jgi:hypothetical protein
LAEQPRFKDVPPIVRQAVRGERKDSEDHFGDLSDCQDRLIAVLRQKRRVGIDQ